MKTNIRLILLFIFLQGICFAGFAQAGLGTNSCNGGDPNPMEEPTSNPDWNNWVEKDITSEAPKYPNEIIGLDGYDEAESVDTFRWVSAAQSLAYTVYFENDADLVIAAASKIPLAHCVRGGMVRFADGRVGKRRAASENVPLPVTSSSPPFFFLFCLQVRNTIPRNVTTLSGISSVWQQTSKKCSLT